ncbi:hypothetical protein B0T24DRAFT_612499 [Lasiosphaeria ovina]|uniref:Uncharacterized protein n=1 Tax=Lasiosphaeria ovina TaxID=92902 RepID=A0AAE0NDR1_9PEZI|nr:hypothetical protein B0T24DRAFT_612499 [Lasiosphaeria ovina]
MLWTGKALLDILLVITRTGILVITRLNQLVVTSLFPLKLFRAYNAKNLRFGCFFQPSLGAGLLFVSRHMVLIITSRGFLAITDRRIGRNRIFLGPEETVPPVALLRLRKLCYEFRGVVIIDAGLFLIAGRAVLVSAGRVGLTIFPHEAVDVGSQHFSHRQGVIVVEAHPSVRRVWLLVLFVIHNR